MGQSEDTGSIPPDSREAGADDDPAAVLEAQVDHALALCDGDARAALRALIVLIRHAEEEMRRLSGAVSRGYMRGDLYRSLVQADWLADGHSGKR